VLYVIDPGRYEAQLASARARLSRAEATLRDTQQDLARTRTLHARSAARRACHDSDGRGRRLRATCDPRRRLGQRLDLRLQALEGQSPDELARALGSLIVAANQEPAMAAAFSPFSADVPQIFVDLDRAKAETLGVPVAEVYRTLQAQLGSLYVNDFNLYDRVYQVRLQADAPYRDEVDDVYRLYARSARGEMVPLRTLVSLSTTLGPDVLARHNQFLAAQINGEAERGASSGEAMAALERLAATTLPAGYGWQWSGLSYQEQRTSGQAPVILALAFIFAYLFLIAQYESWTLPVPVVLSVEPAALGALVAVSAEGIQNSLYVQIGLVLLIGLAAKNAILIVEFARNQRAVGMAVPEAAGARARGSGSAPCS
jgi:multidrug efflux pump subunit AcrB